MVWPQDGILRDNTKQTKDAHTVWMNPESVVLSEISQTQRHRGILRYDQVGLSVIPFLLPSTKNHSDENTAVVVRG